MSRKPLLAIAAVIVMVALLVWWRTRSPSTTTTPAIVSSQGEPPPSHRPAPARQALEPAAPASESERGEQEGEARDLVSYLRERFAATIDNPYVQMRVLDKLIRHYKKLDPAGWRERVLQALAEAFPGRAAELAERLQERLDYQDWMESERDRLRGLEPAERQAAIDQARERIFGDDIAEAIWAGEREQRAVASALSAIDTSVDTSVADKLQMYRQSLDDIHDGDASGYLGANAQQAMDRFLDVASVQRDLSDMDPDRRRQSLRDIRAGMGLDAAALTRWDALDRKRDERWARGKRYMEERAALLQRHQGTELESQLVALRKRYFADQAELIAQEEAGGLLRYDQPRRWGRN